MLAGSILAALALSGGCALTEARDVSLRDRDIRVRDVVSVDCALASDLNARDAIIASIPRDRKQVRLSHRALANLVHRRIPAILLASPDAPTEIIFHAPATRTTADAGSCFAATTAIAAGNAISGADLTPAPCETITSAPVLYDYTYGLARAGGDIAAGAYLGRLNVSAERLPDVGDALTLTATVGATRVERPVTAAQPASGGGALFVRDADGRVFAAPLVVVVSRTP